MGQKKFLVTGSTGFIGSNLVRFLLDKGYEVNCLLREGKSRETNLPKNKSLNVCTISEYTFMNVNDSEALDGVDYVIHLAGVTKGISENDFYNGNVSPTQALLQAINHKNIELGRFVFLSSMAAGGPGFRDSPRKESDKDNPIELYGKSKLEAEDRIKNHQAIPFTIIRPPGVYGPNDSDYLTLFKAAKNPVMFSAGNGHKHQSLIFVEDLVDGIVKAALSKKSEGNTYYMCNSPPVTWGQLYENVKKLSGTNSPVIDIPEAVLRPILAVVGRCGNAYSFIRGETCLFNSEKIKLLWHDWVCSSESAKKDFGFNPKTTLEEGLRKTYEWYKKNQWV